MKFTKEQAIQDLKGRFDPAKGNPLKLSDRTIGEAVDALLQFAGEETELTDFCTRAFSVLSSTNGNLIKETADGIKTYVDAHPAPAPVPAPAPAPAGGLTAEDIAKLLDEKIAPLKNELGAYKQKETAEGLIAAATAIFDKKNPKESLKQWKEEAIIVAKSQIAEGETAETLAAKIEAGYNKYATLAGDANPYIPIEPGGGSGPKAGTPEFFKAQKAELEKDGFIKK